ncbi:thiamine monophosphate kinase [Achromobacter sp. 2789STDY5608633]|nr:thiamine monophosphate kinase [Achromobacter sp. 2789STDY5608633]
MPVAAALAGMPADPVRRAVLGGGDVYQLCFTAPAARRDAVLAAAQAVGARVTRVGRIVAQPGLAVLDADGQALAQLPAGFDHFPAA